MAVLLNRFLVLVLTILNSASATLANEVEPILRPLESGASAQDLAGKAPEEFSSCHGRAAPNEWTRFEVSFTTVALGHDARASARQIERELKQSDIGQVVGPGLTLLESQFGVHLGDDIDEVVSAEEMRRALDWDEREACSAVLGGWARTGSVLRDTSDDPLVRQACKAFLLGEEDYPPLETTAPSACVRWSASGKTDHASTWTRPPLPEAWRTLLGLDPDRKWRCFIQLRVDYAFRPLRASQRHELTGWVAADCRARGPNGIPDGTKLRSISVENREDYENQLGESIAEVYSQHFAKYPVLEGTALHLGAPDVSPTPD